MRQSALSRRSVSRPSHALCMTGLAVAVMASGLAIAVPAMANGGCGETFSGGDGSSGTPYLISEADDVTALKGDFNCWASGTYFEQTADIDMSDDDNLPITWTDHAIGYNNLSRQFEGNYNGGGFEINGLNIDFTGSASSSFDDGLYAGFFGDLEGNVSNLGFTGAVSGEYYVGGLVGYLGNAKQISNSYATGNVTASDNTVGGLVGWLFAGSVVDSYATGSVSGDGSVGGLIGLSSNAGGNLVSRSFATGTVTSTGKYAGGLIGSMLLTSVEDSYATGAVDGTSSEYGGLIGYNRDSTLVRSYSIGSVQGSGTLGGLIGVNDSADVGTSFWDISTSGRSSGAGENKNGGTFNAVGATTSEMQTLSTFEDANWDISDSWVSSNTWGICEGSGYPYLTWQYTSNSEACGDGGSTPAASSGTATYTFTFLTSGGGVCFVDDNVAAGAYALPTSQVACTPEGTELVGWSVPGQVGAFSDGGVVTASGDQTFTAVAKDPTMEVIFDPNVGADTACLLDGSEVEPEQRAVEVTLPRGGVIAEVDICAPTGHTLAGWTDRPTTDGPYEPVEGAMLLTTGMEMPATWNHDPNPVNSIRLYAVWSAAA